MKKVVLAALLALSSSLVNAASPVDILENSAPQADLNSCEAYGLAVADDSVTGTPLRAQMGRQLRVLEQDLRKQHDQLAASTG